MHPELMKQGKSGADASWSFRFPIGISSYCSNFCYPPRSHPPQSEAQDTTLNPHQLFFCAHVNPREFLGSSAVNILMIVHHYCSTDCLRPPSYLPRKRVPWALLEYS